MSIHTGVQGDERSAPRSRFVVVQENGFWHVELGGKIGQGRTLDSALRHLGANLGGVAIMGVQVMEMSLGIELFFEASRS